MIRPFDAALGNAMDLSILFMFIVGCDDRENERALHALSLLNSWLTDQSFKMTGKRSLGGIYAVLYLL